MSRNKWSTWTILTLLTLAIRPAAAELALETTDVAAVEAAGGRVIGQVSSALEQGDGAMRLGKTVCLQFPTDPHFDVRQGTISFHVKPFWNGDDQDELISAWMKGVNWRDKWGEISPAGRFNGSSGDWVAAPEPGRPTD